MKITVDWTDAEREAVGQAIQNEVEAADDDTQDASMNEPGETHEALTYRNTVLGAQQKLLAAWRAAQSTPAVDPHKVVMMLKGYAITVEDLSRGNSSDETAHRFLRAINEESSKILTVLDRPDLLAKL